jgi:hypothetical protein
VNADSSNEQRATTALRSCRAMDIATNIDAPPRPPPPRSITATELRPGMRVGVGLTIVPVNAVERQDGVVRVQVLLGGVHGRRAQVWFSYRNEATVLVQQV